jgi:hypothetical protein
MREKKPLAGYQGRAVRAATKQAGGTAMVQAAPVSRVRVESLARWQQALDRALANGVEVFRISGTGEMVATSASKLDTVYRVDSRHCECDAAKAGDPVCMHRAAARFILGMLVEAPRRPISCLWCRGSGFQENVREQRIERCRDCGGSSIRVEHSHVAIRPAA